MFAALKLTDASLFYATQPFHSPTRCLAPFAFRPSQEVKSLSRYGETAPEIKGIRGAGKQHALADLLSSTTMSADL